MSGHASAESLSLYLDAALPAAERQQVEEHLEDCPRCRQRLDGLRRVVSGLSRLPTAAPPEDLAARVGREINLRGRRSQWRRLLDGGLTGPLLASPPMHILALVLALGAIIYVFAVGLEMSRERPTRIVPVSADTVVVGEPTDRVPSVGARQTGESLYLLGGRFRRADGVWVEEGLAGREPDLRVALDAAATDSPEVAELAALGAPLRLQVADEVVEIAFEPAESSGGPHPLGSETAKSLPLSPRRGR